MSQESSNWRMIQCLSCELQLYNIYSIYCSVLICMLYEAPLAANCNIQDLTNFPACVLLTLLIDQLFCYWWSVYINIPLMIEGWNRLQTAILCNRNCKVAEEKDLVRRSAGCWLVGKWAIWMIPFWNLERTIWQSISMCFVRSWNTGLEAI